jgi:hypothetical protein
MAYVVSPRRHKHRWREYFDQLFNGETKNSTIELDDSFDDTRRSFVRGQGGFKKDERRKRQCALIVTPLRCGEASKT